MQKKIQAHPYNLSTIHKENKCEISIYKSCAKYKKGLDAEDRTKRCYQTAGIWAILKGWVLCWDQSAADTPQVEPTKPANWMETPKFILQRSCVKVCICILLLPLNYQNITLLLPCYY